jgi:hypothetical protein
MLIYFPTQTTLERVSYLFKGSNGDEERNCLAKRPPLFFTQHRTAKFQHAASSA